MAWPWRPDVPVPPPARQRRCRTSTATARAGGRVAARTRGQPDRPRARLVIIGDRDVRWSPPSTTPPSRADGSRPWTRRSPDPRRLDRCPTRPCRRQGTGAVVTADDRADAGAPERRRSMPGRPDPVRRRRAIAARPSCDRSLSRGRDGGGGWARPGPRRRPRERRRSSVPRPSARGRSERSSAATTTRSCRGSSSTATGGAASSRGSSTGPRSWPPAGRCRSGYPPRSRPTEIGGREDLWIRARLVGGDYGRPKYVVDDATNPGPPTSVQSTTIDTSDLHPPEIISIEASFVLDAATAPECVLVVDNLATLDQTQASAADQARFALFSGARAIDPDVDGRALYVGLTRQPVEPTGALRGGRRPGRPGHARGRRAHHRRLATRHRRRRDRGAPPHRSHPGVPVDPAGPGGALRAGGLLAPAPTGNRRDRGRSRRLATGGARPVRERGPREAGEDHRAGDPRLEPGRAVARPRAGRDTGPAGDARAAGARAAERGRAGGARGGAPPLDPGQRSSAVRGAAGRRDGRGGRRHLGALASRRLLHRHGRRRARVPARSRDRARHLRQRPAGEGPAGGQRRDPRLPLPAGRWPAGQRAGVERSGGEVGARGHRGGGAAGGRGRRRRHP